MTRVVGARRHVPLRGLAALLAVAATGVGCTPVVVYTNELVDGRHGRTWFTRLPTTVGGALGFTLGVPMDVVALPATLLVYRSMPKERRDPLSVFLFPSFFLWKVGALLGAPFDAVEWGFYRAWCADRQVSADERQEIEQQWDRREFAEYPVTPIYPRVDETPAAPTPGDAPPAGGGDAGPR